MTRVKETPPFVGQPSRTSLDAVLSNFGWYRRMRGGHWEKWWIDSPVNSAVWLKLDHGERPGLGCGAPICELWVSPPMDRK